MKNYILSLFFFLTHFSCSNSKSSTIIFSGQVQNSTDELITVSNYNSTMKEDFPIDSLGNFEAKVKELIYLGDHIRSRVEVCGNDQFIVKIPNSYKEANLKEGSTVKLSWKASDSRALDLN